MNFLKNIIQILSSRMDYWPWALWAPLFLGGWALSRWPAGQARLNRAAWALPALGGLMLAVFAWFNWVFLRSPVYLGPMSHLQPQIADTSWYFATGRPVYHGTDSAEIYNLLYGPWLYVITGTFEKMLGPDIFSAKLPGALAIGVATVLLFFLLRKKAGAAFAVLGTGVFAALLIMLDPVESLTRADVYIVLGVVLGAWVAQSPSDLTPWAFGLLAGLCFNLKIHAPVYFLPLLWPAWAAGHRGKSLLAALAGAAAAGAAPFLIFPNVSLKNFAWTLGAASAHGLDPHRFLECTETFFLLALPIAIIAALACAQNPGPAAEKLRALRPFLALIFLTFLMLLPFASKYGSGPHHYLPLLVVLLSLAADFAPQVRQWLGGPGLTWIAAQALLFSWLGCGFAVGLTRSYQDAAWLNSSAAWAQDINADLDAILARHGQDSVILMGAGNDQDYIYTFFRTRLVFAGMPDGLEPGPLMEFVAAGKHLENLPKLTAALGQAYPGKKILWLVPKGDRPFAMTTLYAEVMRGDYTNKAPLFDAQFQADFQKHYHLVESTRFYDLYGPTAG
ncbi:MAG TPA: hypothetical protein VHC95_02000 [Opitutales bacterium]|nr:hypothetical protein [Opitutales bacterium]